MQGEGTECPPGFQRGRAGIDGATLPVYTFQQQGVRGEGAVELLTKDIHRRVAEWWASNEDCNRECIGSTTSNGKVLASVDDVSCSSGVHVT